MRRPFLARALARALSCALAGALAGSLAGAPAAAGLRTVPLEERDDAGRAEHLRSAYAKFEHMVPMRDGVRLFTAVYVPDDRSRTYPILMVRTPYSAGPYGADRYPERLGPDAAFEREGFIFVVQDVRGRWMSEGDYENMRPHRSTSPERKVDESTDTRDTIDWLLENVEGHNGRVGMWGISYPGFYTAAGAIDGHPALVAVSPQAPIADWFWDDMHRHGAFVLPLAFRFFSTFGVVREGPTDEAPDPFEFGTDDGYAFFLELGPLKNANARHFKGEIPFWNALTEHPNYDRFWQDRNLLPHLNGIGAAVLTVGGWYDTEDLYGPLRVYAEIERRNPKASNALVMGPWWHGAWNRSDGRKLGDVDFGFPTSVGFREDVQLPWFLHHLKGGPAPDLPEALVFETGANRWRRFDAWPPAGLETRDLYLREGGALSFEPPPPGARTESAPEAAPEAFDAWVSDPAKPVPYTQEITTRWARDYVVEDQRFASRRPDVVVWRSEPLARDLTLAGPIVADLRVSTSGTAADWIVKVVDEYPGEPPGDASEAEKEAWPGHRQQLVRAEAFRGRFRESYSEPQPFEPDVPAQVRFELLDVLHTFRRGHRIQVQIQSTWFPFIDRNPQTWVPNIFEADEADFRARTHRVHRSAELPSKLTIGVLPDRAGTAPTDPRAAAGRSGSTGTDR